MRELGLLGEEESTLNGALTTTNTGLDASLMVCNGGTVDIGPGALLDVPGGLKVGGNAVGSIDLSGSGSTHGTIQSASARPRRRHSG
jgi:hypothetical protein